MSVTESSVVIRKTKKQISENEIRTYLLGSDASLVTALDKDGNPTTVQEFINNSGGGGESDNPEVEVDLQNALPKIKSSNVNGDINVNGEDISVYDEQYIQGKANADVLFAYNKSDNTLEFNYYGDDLDILKDYPAPQEEGSYGAVTPNPLSLSDENPCRIYTKPYFSNNKYDKVWAGGQGKNKGKFIMLDANRLNQQGVLSDSTTDNDRLFIVDPSQKIITRISSTALTVPAFDIVISQSPMSDYLVDGQKYILNGIPEGADGFKFVLRYGAQPTANDKEGKSIIFTYTSTDGPLSIHLVGEAGADQEAVCLYGIKPMIRLASEYDGSFEPYENLGLVAGTAPSISVKQENYDLSNNSKISEESHNMVPLTDSEYNATYGYSFKIDNGYFEAPDGNYYYSVSTQKILKSDGTIYYLRCWSGQDWDWAAIIDTEEGIKGLHWTRENYPSKIGECEVVNSIYNSNYFYFEYSTDGEEYTSYKGDNPPVEFASKFVNSSTTEVLESNVAAFDEVGYKTLFYGGNYFCIYDLGLYSIYNITDTIIFSYDPEYSGPSEDRPYFSNIDGYVDNNNWKQPSPGAFVVVLKSIDEDDSSVSVFGKLSMNLYKDSKVKISIYSIWPDGSGLSIVNKNAVDIVLTCKPGISISRETYKNYLSEDYPTYKGKVDNSLCFDLVDFDNNSVKNSVIKAFPDKKVSAKHLNIDFLPITIPDDNIPCGFDENSSNKNIIDFSSISPSCSPASGVNISWSKVNYQDDYTYTIYYSANMKEKHTILLCSTVDNFISDEEKIVLGIRAKMNDNPNKIYNKNYCYGFLSTSSTPTEENSIIFELNSATSPVIEYDSSYKYFGIIIQSAPNNDKEFDRKTIHFYPIIQEAKQYDIVDEWGGINEIYLLSEDISNRVPLNGNSSNTKNALINNIVPQTLTIEGYKIKDIDNSTPSIDGSISFTGINFYSVHCPYDNNNYKFYYYCIMNPNADQYNRDYAKVTEIWSNYPLIWSYSIQYYNPDNQDWNGVDSYTAGIYVHFEGEDSYNSAIERSFWDGRGMITNIPVYIDESTAATNYATTLLSNATNNQVWGLTIDLKNKKVIKTFDYMGSYCSNSYGPEHVNYSAQEWYGSITDYRFDASPQNDSDYAYVMRTDTFICEGQIRETPCKWDITLTDLNVDDFIIPQSPTDPNAIVRIKVGAVSSANPKVPFVGIGYTMTPFAFSSDLDEINARVDALQGMIISSLNGSY